MASSIGGIPSAPTKRVRYKFVDGGHTRPEVYIASPPKPTFILFLDGEAVVDPLVPIVREITDEVKTKWEWIASIGNPKTPVRDWDVMWDGNPNAFTWVRNKNIITMQYNEAFTQPQNIDVSVYADNKQYSGTLKLNYAGGYYYYYPSTPSTPIIYDITGTGAAWSNDIWTGSQGYWDGSKWVTGMPGQILLHSIGAISNLFNWYVTIEGSGAPLTFIVRDINGSPIQQFNNVSNNTSVQLTAGFVNGSRVRFDMQSGSGSFNVTRIRLSNTDISGT